MTVEKILSKSSGGLFFSGFMLSKLQYLPFPVVSAAFRFISLGLYLLGYISWFVASLLQPDHKHHHDKWYGFAKIKEQFLLSSCIGFIGAILSVVAVFIPILFPPAAFIFFLGNIIWTIGEFHKLKNPPGHDEHFSSTQQKSYVHYAVTTTAISLITAVAATLMVIFPAMTLTITIFSLLVCVGLGALAFEFWLDTNFGKHSPTHTQYIPQHESYSTMSHGFGSSCVLEHSFSLESDELKTIPPSPLFKRVSTSEETSQNDHTSKPCTRNVTLIL